MEYYRWNNHKIRTKHRKTPNQLFQMNAADLSPVPLDVVDESYREEEECGNEGDEMLSQPPEEIDSSIANIYPSLYCHVNENEFNRFASAKSPLQLSHNISSKHGGSIFMSAYAMLQVIHSSSPRYKNN